MSQRWPHLAGRFNVVIRQGPWDFNTGTAEPALVPNDSHYSLYSHALFSRYKLHRNVLSVVICNKSVCYIFF